MSLVGCGCAPWPLALAAMSATACAGAAQAPPNAVPATRPGEPSAAHALRLDGVVVRTAPDPLTGLESYDAQTLMHLAGEALRNERLEVAAALYERLTAELPESAFALAASFGLGRVRERQGRLAPAIAAYRSIVELGAPAEVEARTTWLDAHYRLAACQDDLGAPWEAVATFDRVLALSWITSFDQLEALVGRGRALLSAQANDAAEIAFGQAVRVYEQGRADEQLAERTLAGEAALAWGGIAAERYLAVELAFPVAVLRTQLEQKCELLLAAQQRLLRAVRYGDGSTVAAAGFRIGSLYESLHETITELEIPAELNSEQQEIYREEVRQRVAVLVQKAIMVYERTLLVGRNAPGAEPWITRIEQALERLKHIYLEDDVGRVQAGS